MKKRNVLMIIVVLAAFAAGISLPIIHPLIKKAKEKAQILANANAESVDYWQVKWITFEGEEYLQRGFPKEQFKLFLSENEAIAFAKYIQEAYTTLNMTYEGAKVSIEKQYRTDQPLPTPPKTGRE